MIAGVQKTTLIDFPPYIACTLFTKGCNFRCPYCHNPELVDNEMPDIPLDEVFTFLSSRRKLLDGVCVSGGEPTIHGKQLIELLYSMKQMGFMLKLDTNGSNPTVLREIVGERLVDYVAMDVKSARSNYNVAAGVAVDLDAVSESINLLKESRLEHEFRTTVLPTIHGKQELEDIIEWLSPSNIVIQQFRNMRVLDKRLHATEPYSEDEVKQLIGHRKENLTCRGFNTSDNKYPLQ